MYYVEQNKDKIIKAFSFFLVTKSGKFLTRQEIRQMLTLRRGCSLFGVWVYQNLVIR